MKITVTGSLGYISTPLIKKLVKKGHLVTVISSNPEKKMPIEAMGATAAIGTMEDLNFLTNTFTGADAVYCMLAPYGNLADPDNDADRIIELADVVAKNYVKAIEDIIISMMQNIQMEYNANMDKFSQDIIISMIETLLNYADRFYHRQFLTRKIENHQMLNRLENLLTKYFDCSDLITQGLPSVQYVAKKLNISPNYLSSLLKVLTGRNTQQHIQDKMIEKAKEKISATDLSVSEISYALGFEHPQSFSRLFKAKTGLSPLAFRQSFN